MKFRHFLVKEILRLKNKYNITHNRRKSKHKDYTKRINQLFKLTTNINQYNYNSIDARLYFISNGFKICPECGNNVYTFDSECCSYNCSNKLLHKRETPENKKLRVTKSAATRDYKSIASKRFYTMSNTKDENGNNLHKIASIKAAETMKNTTEENGLTIAQNRALIAAETIGTDGYRIISQKALYTRKENNTNSSLNYWSILPYNQKKDEVNKRTKKGIATKISNGTIKPIEDRDSFDVYCNAASFKHGFKTNCKKQNDLLKEHGVFNARTNTKGCVRDHLLSRRYGFDNNIATWIIAHPANCEIVLNSENVRRANTNDNLITLEELLERIENWIE